MTLREFISISKTKLTALYDPREAQAIAVALYSTLLHVPAYTHVTEPGHEISREDEVLLSECLRRLCTGEPLQYVTGKTEFHGLEFKVSPAVLIPRPETEQLCRILLEETVPSLSRAGLRILDLCTGSGCIAWTLANYVRGSEVTAVDISEKALGVASSQDIGSNVPEFLLCDVLDDASDVLHDRKFDLMVSNPPYVRNSEKVFMHRNVLDYEPSGALFVTDDDPLVFYRAIARIASRHLAPGGCLAVEINEAFGHAVRDLFIAAGFRNTVVRQDLSGRDRFVISAGFQTDNKF